MIPTSRVRAAAGALAGVAGLVAGQATVWLLQARHAPLAALAAGVRDLPGLGGLGTNVSKGFTLVVLVALFALIGVRLRSWLGDLALVALAAVTFGCVVRLHGSNIESVIGVLVALGTWVLVRRLLTSPLPPASEPLPDTSRRSFLVLAGVVVVGTAVVGGFGWASRKHRKAVEQTRRLLRLPAHLGVVPDGAKLGVVGITPWRTSGADFYRVRLSDPVIDIDKWTLKVTGLVDRELTFTYADLAARTFTEEWVTLCSVTDDVGGHQVGNAYWSGIRISELLAEAGVRAGAQSVVQVGQDGWTSAAPLAAMTDGRRALLALAMNGAPLEIEQGYPARTVVPGYYDHVASTRWIVELQVVGAGAVETSATRDGWTTEAVMLPQSRIDVPLDGAGAPPGTLTIGGVAWAPRAGIATVEVQVDGGAWTTARIGKGTSNGDSWVQWVLTTDLAAGDHQLRVRATDRTGRVQTDVITAAKPFVATGLQQISVKVG